MLIASFLILCFCISFINADRESNDLSLTLKNGKTEEDLKDDTVPVLVIENPFYFYEESNQELQQIEVFVESNSILKVGTFKDNSSTGMVWRILNEDEIEGSDFVDYIGPSCYEFLKTYDGFNSTKLIEDPITGCPGVRNYNFRIWEATLEDELPSIKVGLFGYRASNPIYKTVEFILKVKESTISNDSLPVININYNGSNEEEVYVESNTILEINGLSESRSLGSSWFIINDDELDSSKFIDIVGKGSSGLSSGTKIVPGGSINVSYKFRINHVTSEDELPVIQLGQGRYGSSRPYVTYNIVLKVKGVEKKECTFDGYQCCTLAKTKAIYEDKDGKWGVENGDWCYFKETTCFSQKLGYPCCKGKKVVYIDDDGKWGVEDGQWCGINN